MLTLVTLSLKGQIGFRTLNFVIPCGRDNFLTSIISSVTLMGLTGEIDVLF